MKGAVTTRRRLLHGAFGTMLLAALTACGRKGEVIDLLPPPAPEPTPPPSGG